MSDRKNLMNLLDCEREPIRIPGSIQPHGILLAADRAGRVYAASDNAGAMFAEPIGSVLSDLLPGAAIDITSASAAQNARYAGALPDYDIFVHRSAQGCIVELERAAAVRPTATEVLEQTVATSVALGSAGNLDTAVQIAAEAVRTITGYDRVMVYRFLDDGTGQVVAEARAEGISPLLNHRYPASDIPRQARALYLENPIRVIPDVAYEPVPLRSGADPVDLSGALLRSVSPVHIQYLKNMEVGASASLSIIHEGQLWGLIACHHTSARPIGHERREMARQATLALEAAIHRLEDEASQREALRLTRRREELLPLVASAEELSGGLASHLTELAAVIPSDGLALLAEGKVHLHGVTPPRGAVASLADWLFRPQAPAVWATSQLSRDYPSGESGSAQASGLLSIVLRNPKIAIMWFRAEQIETVNWAGNPHEPLDPSAPAGTLSPRRSFALWVEQVRGHSRPWRTNEQDAARRLADRLEEIAHQISLARMNHYLGDSLTAKDASLAEKDLLMREVHHRVQNNLQLVTSMLRLQKREVEDEAAQRQLMLASDRIQSISTLHRRLWRSDDLQLVNLETFFAELTTDLVRTWGDEWQDQLRLEVSPIRLSGSTALLLGLAVTELLTNAFKHAYGGNPGPIVVTAAENGKGRVAVVVADKGVGTDGSGRAGSFGSKLLHRLVEQASGELRFAPNHPGTAVTLVLPIPAG